MKTYGCHLGPLRPLKDEKAKKGEQMILAVAGFVAQAQGHDIDRRVFGVDLIFGPQTYHKLAEMLALAARETDLRKGPGLSCSVKV